MNGSTGGKIYSDIKKATKRVLVFISFFILLLICVGGVYYTYNTYQSNSKENDILNKAIKFTDGKSPFVFIRYDFSDKSELDLWITLDTDNRTIMKINDDYAVFLADYSNPNYIYFTREAGSICSSASAIVYEGKVASVKCDNREYLKNKE